MNKIAPYLASKYATLNNLKRRQNHGQLSKETHTTISNSGFNANKVQPNCLKKSSIDFTV